jgi:hypothetical protein
MPSSIVVFTSKDKISNKELTTRLQAFIVYITVNFDPIFKISFDVESLYPKLLVNCNIFLDNLKQH